MKFIAVIAILFIVGLIIYLYFKYVKTINIGALTMVTGAVKSGKSLLSVRLAVREYKKRLFRYKLRKFLNKYLFLKFIKVGEEPLLYSNIPLNITYSPLNLDEVLRTQRFNYESVVYICEASLLADNTVFRYPAINQKLNYFCKLFGHESKGGCLIYDTQAVGDLAVGIRRCISSNIFVHHSRKGLFFHWMWLLEERYSEDGSVSTTYTSDVEDNLKLLLIPKKIYKLYDRYCYSYFTDSKPVGNDLVIRERKKKYDLRATEIVSFKEGIIKEL